MRGEHINRVSGRILIVVVAGCFARGAEWYFQPPQPDEGAAAHVFQISIVVWLPMVLIFLATIDWKQRLRSTRVLTLPAALLILAFGAPYDLEHYGMGARPLALEGAEDS
jgi:hypothetical protein